MIMPQPKRSINCIRKRWCGAKVRGLVAMLWNSRPWNGCIGITTPVRIRTVKTLLQCSSRITTILKSVGQRWLAYRYELSTELGAIHGVDEHVWRHTPFGSKYVTVIIDLTPIRDRTGPSRLLDIVEGRSKKAFKTWLAAQSQAFRHGIEDIAMNGFAGYKSAAAEEQPDAVPVMDPFHVVALAGGAVERCRQRIQQETLGHRRRSGDPLYGVRRVLLTGANLLTQKQVDRLDAVLAAEEHTPVDVTWWVYQRVVGTYRDPDRVRGRARMQAVITSLAVGVPAALSELTTLGRTLKRRAADVLAY